LIIYRYCRDLRIDDHAGLAAAAAHGDVLPALIIDRRLQRRLARSPRRAAFFCGAVRALDRALREHGSRLVVRRGTLTATIRSIARAVGTSIVAWGASYDGDGLRADAHLRGELEAAGMRVVIAHDAPAIGPEETTAARPSEGEGYRSFGPYYDLWRTLPMGSFDKPLLIRFAQHDLQSEPLPQPGEFEAKRFAIPDDVGPASANRALAAFLDGAALNYAVAIHVPAEDTSKLSAHLSFGTIAARAVLRATLTRIENPFVVTEERAALRLFTRSLALRDFFLQLSWYHPQTSDLPLQEKMRDFPFADTHPQLEAWRAGETGYPLVDAGVRQLRATGWMHPHVRAIVASFLCFDLGVDWRVGRDAWERDLIEDDPSLASGNWQWIAGVGADMAQYPRIYNPEKQRRHFDPNGAYVKRWIPELAHIPAGAIGAASMRGPQTELGLFADRPYAPPIIEHEREARAFLARYRAHVST
jgi:deoxyribodipyrimidine photo-lyase